jgi:hypothetical protein
MEETSITFIKPPFPPRAPASNKEDEMAAPRWLVMACFTVVMLLLAYIPLHAADWDGDGVDDSIDNCFSTVNPDQQDDDADGFGNACDYCDGNGQYDLDEDGLCDLDDNCYSVYNPDQSDSDGDGYGDVCTANIPLSYPVETFRGSYESIGRQIAKRYPDTLIYVADIFSRLGVTARVVQGRYDEIEDLIPQSIKDHIRGMAHGLQEARSIEYQKAWDMVLLCAFAIDALNIPDKPGASGLDTGCTAFAVSSPAGTFLAHNTDNQKTTEHNGSILRIVPNNGDNSYIHLFTPAFVDVGLGMNDKGIGITYNVGRPNNHPLPGLPPLFMVRRVMEKAATLKEAVEYFTDFLDRGNSYGYNGTIFLLVDFKDSSMAKIQIKSDAYKVSHGEQLKPGVTYIATTNHFDDDFAPLSPEDKAGSSTISSLARWDRLMELLPQFDTYDLDTCFSILTDHGDGKPGPNTICRDSGTPFGTATTLTNIFTADALYYTTGRPDRYLEVYGAPIRIELKPTGLCAAELLYGERSEEVRLLKRFRDTVLQEMPDGKKLIQLYYRISPDMVSALQKHAAVRVSLKTLLDQLLPLLRWATD